MPSDVGAGTSLPTPLCNCMLKGKQRTDDSFYVRSSAESVTFIGELAERSMPSLVVASFACGYFVLDPTRPTLDSRNEVFGSGLDQSIVEQSTAPDTTGTVALDDDGHPLPAVWLTSRFGHTTRMVAWRDVSHLLLLENSILGIFGLRSRRP